uniref:Heparan-sulfate 6-O-sulfotransferase n=1 Tax=Eptatretus burgeri TaxID=7764 RepID=A0A8C4R0L8_EPTBU
MCAWFARSVLRLGCLRAPTPQAAVSLRKLAQSSMSWRDSPQASMSLHECELVQSSMSWRDPPRAATALEPTLPPISHQRWPGVSSSLATDLTCTCEPRSNSRIRSAPQCSFIFFRRYHYVTILREPVSRYISEWRHVQRGATWRAALHRCARRAPTPAELPPCYSSRDWTGVSLEDFMGCTSNLANNRQVRMLADLKLVGCYNTSSMHDPQRSRILLESAKLNLRQMAFFGLTEEQRHTQQLFEWTFGLRFSAPFEQHNVTHAAGIDLGTAAMARIHHLNRLDMELYNYAHNLFLQRYATMARQQVLLAQGYS